MPQGSDVRLGQLTRYLFTAPSWKRSLILIAFLGFLIDIAGVRSWVILRVSPLPFSGTIAFTLPAILAFLATKPLIEFEGKAMTWNRSALLALACTVFAVIITLSVRILNTAMLPLFYAIALGFVFGIRLLVLVAIADYRISRMLAPAFIQSGAGILAGMYLFYPAFGIFALVLHLVFGLITFTLIWLIERPLYRAFRIRGLAFVNAFIAHTTDGSRGMEEFFREIGEEIFVPQVCLFFLREPKKPVLFTVPNLHPGPMGEIGGGNLPRIVHDSFEEETLVAHGSASHDFNLVSESEISKVIDAIRESKRDLSYTGTAGKSGRLTFGSVHILYQRFGDALLLVSTRSPQRTEDLEYGIGMAIMSEGHRFFPHIAFVDAHNCMTDLSSPIHIASQTATEYHQAALNAMEIARGTDVSSFAVGVAHHMVPYTREQGFGDLGIQALIVEVDQQKTAYVLIDGNNMAERVRETLLTEILALVDHAEVMTTDSHVVNTFSGKNPIGLHIPVQEFAPAVLETVRAAIGDLAPATVAGSTAQCKRVVVFGSNTISQLASTVNTMLIYVAPLSLAMLLLAFLLSLVAYIVIV
jgi:putative membrane protein